MTRNPLLELAERVEKAEPDTGASLSLVALEDEVKVFVWNAYRISPRPFLHSLDAAMSLVPEGCEGLPLSFKVERYYLGNGIWKSRASVWDGLGGVSSLNTASEAATPALALTAACLRARARANEEAH